MENSAQGAEQGNVESAARFDGSPEESPVGLSAVGEPAAGGEGFSGDVTEGEGHDHSSEDSGILGHNHHLHLGIGSLLPKVHMGHIHGSIPFPMLGFNQDLQTTGQGMNFPGLSLKLPGINGIIQAMVPSMMNMMTHIKATQQGLFSELFAVDPKGGCKYPSIIGFCIGSLRSLFVNLLIPVFKLITSPLRRLGSFRIHYVRPYMDMDEN